MSRMSILPFQYFMERKNFKITHNDVHIKSALFRHSKDFEEMKNKKEKTPNNQFSWINRTRFEKKAVIIPYICESTETLLSHLPLEKEGDMKTWWQDYNSILLSTVQDLQNMHNSDYRSNQIDKSTEIFVPALKYKWKMWLPKFSIKLE